MRKNVRRKLKKIHVEQTVLPRFQYIRIGMFFKREFPNHTMLLWVYQPTNYEFEKFGQDEIARS